MLTERELKELFIAAVGPLTPSELRCVWSDETAALRAGNARGLERALDSGRNVIVVRDGAAPV